MRHYSLAVFEPDAINTSCVVIYYCSNWDMNERYPSESHWVVPGTWEL